MDFESIFCLQRKNKEGILLKILKKSEEKEKLIMEIQNNAINDDFASLYIVSLNRNIFDQNFVSDNDFKLNAISEIINIMDFGEGDTGFQNEIINYLMQVKENYFLMYVLDNLLYREKYFDIKNLRVFISTLSADFKSSKLDDEQKEKLKDIIYKHFFNMEKETQEALIRMLEIVKIVDIFEMAVLFNKAEGHIKKKLADAIKSNAVYKKDSQIINSLNISDSDLAMFE